MLPALTILTSNLMSQFSSNRSQEQCPAPRPPFYTGPLQCSLDEAPTTVQTKAQSAPASVNALIQTTVDANGVSTPVLDANGNVKPMIRRDANGNPIRDANGAEIPILGQARFQLAIGSVSNPSALAVVSNGNGFQTSLASGEINIVSNAAASNAASLGGNVVTGGAFEASNVEIGRLLIEGVKIQRRYNAIQSVLGIVAKFMSNFFSTVGKVAA